MFEIRRYSADKADEWNAFVATSKNGTFLFDRRYMDYHSADVLLRGPTLCTNAC